MKTNNQGDISISLLKIIKRYCKTQSISYPNKTAQNSINQERISFNQLLGISLDIEEKFHVSVYEELLQLSSPNDLFALCLKLISSKQNSSDSLQN